MVSDKEIEFTQLIKSDLIAGLFDERALNCLLNIYCFILAKSIDKALLDWMFGFS